MEIGGIVAIINGLKIMMDQIALILLIKILVKDMAKFKIY